MTVSATGVTSEVPPTSDQGNQPTAEATAPAGGQGQTDDAGDPGHEEFVPYARFKQLLDENNSRKAWDGVVEKIKSEAGFQSPAEVLAFAEQESQAQANQAIEQRLQAQVDAGEISPDLAEQIYQREVRAKEMERRLSATEQRQAIHDLESARARYPEMDEDAVMAQFALKRGSIMDLAKKSHEKIEAKIAQKATGYREQKEEQAHRPVPLRSGGGSPGKAAIPNPVSDPAGWKAYRAKIESDLQHG
jgi:hypothetical protein